MKFKNFLKSFGSFLWSFINPRKMEVHRDMNLFIVVLVFLMCGILCAGVPSLRLEKIVKDRYLNECYVYEDAYSAELVDFDVTSLPHFELSSSNTAAFASVEGYQEYDLVYKSEENELPINVKIVYELDKDRDDELTFDLNAYLSDVPFDENKQLKSRDLLIVYTDTILYYIYNHGYNPAYASTSGDVSIEDYHYLYIKSWADTGKWSLYDSYADSEGKLTPYLYFPAEDEVDLDNTKWTAKFVAEYDSNGNLINNVKTIGKHFTGVFHYVSYDDGEGNLTPYLYFPTEEEVELDSKLWTDQVVAEYDEEGNLTNNVKTVSENDFTGVYHYVSYDDGAGNLTPYLFFPTIEEMDLPDSNWTSMIVAEYDDDNNLVNNQKIIGERQFTGVYHYTKVINKIFTCEEKLNVGVYSYLECEGNDTAYRNLFNPLATFSDMMVTSSVTSVKVYSYILAAFYVVVLPIMWVLIMWLILHKNGELQRLREYYAVAAAAMILPSIITAIVGLWIPYTIMSRIAMIVQAVWYFVVCTIINTAKKHKTVVEEVAAEDAPEGEFVESVPETAPLSAYEEKEEVHHSRVE